MSGRPLVPLLLAVALFGLYGVRAVTGWIGGPAYSEGRQLAANGQYEEALPALERGTLGPRRAATLWLRGQVRIGIWEYRMDLGDDPAELAPLLTEAHREYTEALSLSPASGWYWASLGDLHHQQERLERREAGVELHLLGKDPRERVGEQGRLAIGLTRTALAREPEVYQFRDQLAMILWSYGLRDEALAAVRESAEVQPVYRFHAYESLGEVPPELIDAFAEGARAAEGKTPFLRRTLYLLALGRIEYRRGNLELAEAEFREALRSGAERLNRAEGNYYLGQILRRTGRYDEADEALIRAEEHENFRAAALIARSEIAEERGRIPEALDLMRRAQRLEPGNLAVLLKFARLAGDHGEERKAEEALRWAATIEPRDPRPWRALVSLFLAHGDLHAATEALGRLRQLTGETEEVRRFQTRIERYDAG